MKIDIPFTAHEARKHSEWGYFGITEEDIEAQEAKTNIALQHCLEMIKANTVHGLYKTLVWFDSETSFMAYKRASTELELLGYITIVTEVDGHGLMRVSWKKENNGNKNLRMARE